MTNKIQCHRKQFILTSVVTLLLVAVLFTTVSFIPLPALSAFVRQECSIPFYDNDEIILQVTPVEDGVRREFTPLANIPKGLIHAFIEAEDSRFYLHNGVDYSAALRAFSQNASEKRRVSGASTITMQLAGMVYPSKKRGWYAKIKDTTVAHLIESRLTKDEILELYLNNVPFGNNVEGVTSAGRFFFGLELQQLSPGQTSCLSVIPRRPVSYNPIDNPATCSDSALRIFNIVYGLDLPEVSSLEEAQDYLLASAQSARKFEWPFSMPHYIPYVKKTLKDGQCRSFLSIKSDLQKLAEFGLKEALRKAASSRIHNGAILVIENKTAQVLAWVGNNDWFDEEHGGQIDGVLVPNQPGSSMKPFLYALSLEQKTLDGMPLFVPAQIIPDIPMEFGSDTLYIPLNFNNKFNGPVLFRTTLASSLNVPAVYILSKIGVDNYIEFLLTLGFESLRYSGKEADLGLALGAGEVSLAELVCGFSVFPRDGVYLPMSFEKDAAQEEPARRVMESDTARIICNILSDKAARVKGFGYSQVFETSYPSIFKTGTANQYQNIVALGATKEYTVGVWMGNFSGDTVVGKTGSSLPATIAKTLLDFLNDDKQISFEEPEHWKKIPVCTVSGMKAGNNCPSSVYEYVPADSSSATLGECTWHQRGSNNKIITTYPAEFQQWFKEGFRKGVLDHSSSPLRIITPVDGSVFQNNLSDKKRQKILVEVIGGKEDDARELLRVLYDDAPLKEKGKTIIVERPFSFYLPIEKGHHTLKVMFGNEEHSIEITVK